MPKSKKSRKPEQANQNAYRWARIHHVRQADPADGSGDEGLMTISFTFSSEAPYLRHGFEGDWVEILGHDKDEIDLSRMAGSAPLLWGHGQAWGADEPGLPIGRITRAWVKDGKAHAEATISRRDEIAGIRQDIEDAILVNTSVGYQINEKKLIESPEDGPDVYRVTSWVPFEASLVDVPADPTVGRSQDNQLPPPGDGGHDSRFAFRGKPKKGKKVPKRKTKAATAPALSRANPEDIAGDDVDSYESRDQATTDTRAGHSTEVSRDPGREPQHRAEDGAEYRRDAIRSIFAPHADQDALRDACIADPECSITQAGTLLRVALGARSEPAGGGGRVEMRNDEHDKWLDGASDALMMRAGLLRPDRNELMQNPFRGMSLIDHCRQALDRHEIDYRGRSRMEMVGTAFTHQPLYRNMQVTSDFPELLSATANKAMMQGFTNAVVTYPIWCRRGSLPDFKSAKRITPAAFANLRVVAEGASYQYLEMPDSAESILLVTYGELFSLSRQAIINDDLSEFTRLPEKLGATARRTVDHVCVNAVVANPTMRDGLALFHASHNNLAAPGGPPDTPSVEAARAAIATQTNETKPPSTEAYLNLIARVSLVPFALGGQMRTVNRSSAWVESGNANAGQANPVRDQFTGVVEHAVLDAANPKSWYVMTDPYEHDTVEVAFLDGEETPFLDTDAGWTVDGTDMKVRIDAGASVLDWRGMFKNDGGI